MGQAEANLASRLIKADKKTRKTIIFLGDPMTDVYVYGTVAPCQDGCTKLIENKPRVLVPGGAANAVRSLQNWSCQRKFLFNGFPCSVKTRFMFNDQCIFRHDDDRNDYDFGPIHRACIGMMRESHYDAVLISDYDKGAMTEGFIQDVITICRERGVPCVSDAKRAPYVYTGSILKCNHDYSRGNKNWWENHRGPSVLTLGENYPISNQDGNSDSVHMEPLGWTPRVSCINHVGAGDCFAAHLTLALAHGFSLKDAAAIAHAAGRVYVQHRHNKPPDIEAICADMETWRRGDEV